MGRLAMTVNSTMSRTTYAHEGQGKDAAGVMPVGGFVQQWQKSQQTDADARDEDGRQPFDLANDGDLPVEGEEFEEEEEIPFGRGR
jgi:hypothetical protein